MSRLQDDPRLTAYALGELDPAEALGLEAELAEDPAARAEVEEIRKLGALLERELASSMALALGASHKARLEDAWGGPATGLDAPVQPRKRSVWRTRVVPALALAVALAPLALVGWWALVPGGDVISDDEVQVTFMAPEAAPASAAEFGPQVRNMRFKAARPQLTPPASVDGPGPAEGFLDGVEGLQEHPRYAARTRPNERYPAQPNTERYTEHEENPFVPVASDPRSTFSIDVDTASYALVRRFLHAGELPPRGAVRIEELVNYFSYAYPEPPAAEPFTISALVTEAPWAPEHRLLRIGLKAREIAAAQRPASNLVFLIDVSGSMDQPDKLPLLQEGLRMLVGKLDARDRIAIVVYAGSSGLVLPSTRGDRKGAILSALDQLAAGGSTNGGEGIQLAYEIATRHFVRGGVNRVLLATDGDFNVGVTDQSALVALIQEQAKTGVFLSVLGFGQGNYQDATLEQLADKGNGNYAYIDSRDEAHKVLVAQAAGTLITVAKDVKLQLEWNPGEVRAFRLLGYENRVLAHEDFHDDRKDAGEIGAGHTVTAFYELVPAGARMPDSSDQLKYQQPAAEPSDPAHRGELLTLKLRYKLPDAQRSQLRELVVRDSRMKVQNAPADFRFGAAVTAFGMLLRDSPHRGQASFQQVLELAQPARGNGRDREARDELIELVRRARTLAADASDQ
jgi:Ca-activated chloride channel homolog